MPIQILMPALSPTMEEGTLAKWLVTEGDAVTPGMVIAEIETDKATMEVEAIEEGSVGKILVAEGTEGVAVNTPIALLLEEGDDPAAVDAGNVAASASAANPGPVLSETEQDNQTGGLAAVTTPVEEPAASNFERAPEPTANPARPERNGQAGPARTFASPLARRMARDAGIELSAVAGSGPHGRIIKADIDRLIAEGIPASGAESRSLSTEVSEAVPVPGKPAIEAMPDEQILALYDAQSYEVVPHDGMRRVIAQRLTQSKQTIPHFYMTVECVLEELLRARTRINDAAPTEGPRAYRLSVNDFVIKALALALQQVPAANATWTVDGMLQHRHSDVGVAVAVEGGLFTPVIRHAELKTLGEISNEMKDLAGRARKRRLAPHEYQGGTTSISNLGMYGIKLFDAVINPPHATILAVGAGERRPIVVGDDVKVATIMNCTLSCDHRVVDGAVGAELLNAFKTFIEDPVRMLV
ncbi:MAG: pyruvate dehydrogenase complex dihydrolipoamide acetyltransferase [Hyphomicrobiaceae bacterium]